MKAVSISDLAGRTITEVIEGLDWQMYSDVYVRLDDGSVVREWSECYEGSGWEPIPADEWGAYKLEKKADHVRRQLQAAESRKKREIREREIEWHRALLPPVEFQKWIRATTNTAERFSDIIRENYQEDLREALNRQAFGS